jgi:hypothetical protein
VKESLLGDAAGHRCGPAERGCGDLGEPGRWVALVGDVDQEEAGQMLAGLRVRAVGVERLAIAPTEQARRRRVAECLAADQFAVHLQFRQHRLEVVVERLPLFGRQNLELGEIVAGGVTPRLRVGMDHEDVPHRISLWLRTVRAPFSRSQRGDFDTPPIRRASGSRPGSTRQGEHEQDRK